MNSELDGYGFFANGVLMNMSLLSSLLSGIASGPPPAVGRVVPIVDPGDLLAARRAVREAAAGLGFRGAQTLRLVTAASELARNILDHAGRGIMRVRPVLCGGRSGLELEFEDQGPGIADLERAMEEGFSTRGGTGMGLPGARHLLDEMSVSSPLGGGTMIRSRMWRRA